MIKVKKGATRIVFIFKKFVIKIPTFIEWRLFLNGLLANMQERRFSGVSKDLCPVICADSFGFVLIMERAAVLPLSINHGNFSTYIENKYKNHDLESFMLSDSKPSNWGILKGRLVKVDYGN